MLRSEESQKKASELQFTFENERKEKEIDLIKKEQEIQRRINTQDREDMNLILIDADSNLTWMQNLQDSIIPTGNRQLDSLLVLYDFSLQEYYN